MHACKMHGTERHEEGSGVHGLGLHAGCRAQGGTKKAGGGRGD